MNSPLRCSKTLRQTLNASANTGNFFMIIQVLSNYPTNQATPAAYEKSVSKLSFQNALALRYHDSNVD